MGAAPLPQVATEIADASGHCGHNAEYLLRLANFMKEHVPDAWDEHLYLLEHLVRSRLKEKNICVEDIMTCDPQVTVAAIAGGFKDEQQEEPRQEASHSPNFASQVPSRKLKCLDL